MRYIDSGYRDPSQALGTWLAEVLRPEIAEVRWQSGFFSGDSLAILQATERYLSENERTVNALIGSNDRCTSRQDVDRLVSLIGVPRERAQLGVVSYEGGYYHPKTFHVRRDDGSQAAYVGSANLTGSGVASLHIEAGVIVDTREGDQSALLDAMASAVDSWFEVDPPGLYRVTTPADVGRLVNEGILAEQAPQRTRTGVPGRTEAGTARSRLRPLIRLPRLRILNEPEFELIEPIVLPGILLPSAPRGGFPDYLLFAPGQETPTEGITALSGASLPGGAMGLIIRLSLDTARHFAGKPGTANLSIPVATLWVRSEKRRNLSMSR